MDNSPSRSNMNSAPDHPGVGGRFQPCWRSVGHQNYGWRNSRPCSNSSMSRELQHWRVSGFSMFFPKPWKKKTNTLSSTLRVFWIWCVSKAQRNVRDSLLTSATWKADIGQKWRMEAILSLVPILRVSKWDHWFPLIRPAIKPSFLGGYVFRWGRLTIAMILGMWGMGPVLLSEYVSTCVHVKRSFLYSMQREHLGMSWPSSSQRGWECQNSCGQ